MKKSSTIFAFLLLLLASLSSYSLAPTITSFTPASGPPGTLVTITGTNLGSPTAFTIGGVTALAISNTGTTLVGFVMPAAATGTVSITTAGGAATGSSNFTVTSTPYPSAQQGSKLVGTGATGNAGQGYSVAVSANGSTAIVGGSSDNSDAGAAWIYTQSGGTWTQQGSKLVGTGATGAAQQGASVAVSADGNTAIVGGLTDNSEAGAAWIYTRSGTTWTQQGSKLVGTGATGDAWQGGSVSLSADGNTAIVGGHKDNSNAGAAWVYTRSGTTWTQQGGKLVGTGAVGATVFQGISVALSADGNTAIVGGNLDNSDAGAAWVYTRSGTTWTQQGSKLVGTGATGTAEQGYSVALSANGNTAIVGGWFDNSEAGAAWIYTRSGTTWTQQGSKLVGTGAVNGSGGANQGNAVSLSADGNTAIVGGYDDNSGKGAMWIYTQSGGTWTQQGSKLVGTGATGAANQGYSVALSADGNTAIVGGSEDNSGAGAAWVYTVAAPTITSFTPTSGPPGTLVTITGTNLGSPTAFTIGGVTALAISNTGTTLVGFVMPTAATGAVSITTNGGIATAGGNFTVTATPYPGTQQGSKLVGTGATGAANQGYSVALSADGNTAIVGGSEDNSNAGAAWVYTRSGTTWTQQGGKLVGTGATGVARQGISVSLSADGNTAIVGGNLDNSDAGAAWVYTRSGTTWTQQGSKLVGTGAVNGVGGANQGNAVSLSADGNTAIVGGWFDNSSTGAAWIYTRSGTTWTQQGSKLVGTGAIGNAEQGISVSLSADGNTAIVGGDLDNSVAGAAWVYTRSGTTWTQQGSKLVGTGATGTAEQGYSVALSANGNTAIVGGNFDNSDAGAAWIYTRSGTTWTQQGSKLVGTGAIGNAWQGYSVSLSADGNTAIVGGFADNDGTGAAWAYTRAGSTWTQQGSKLVGTGAIGGAEQGWSVSLSADGNTAIVGGYADNGVAGAAWVYTIAPAPTISSFTPASGPPGTLVTISGTNLSNTGSQTALSIGGVTALVISNTGTTLVGFVMPTAATGTVSITTNGGIATAGGNFTVTATPYPGTQQGSKLVGTGAIGIAEQGYSVSLSADGNTAIVGGWFDNSSTGAAWIYTRSGTTWTQQGSKLVGTGAIGNAEQGYSVSLSADGNTAIVGGWLDNSDAGAAWVYTRSGTTWTQQGSKLVGTGATGVAQQGYSVSLSADGNTAIVGGTNDNSAAGAAWIYTRSGTTWTQQGSKLVGTGATGVAEQGYSVSLSADGNTAIVGGWFDNTSAGAAWIYTRSGGTWSQQGSKLVGTGAIGNAEQGISVSLSADGNTAIVGGPNDNSYAGAAWIYTRSGTTWTQQGSKLVGTGAIGNAEQGISVSLSADGNTAIVGGYADNDATGAAWAYTRAGSTWTQQGSKLVGTGAIGDAEQGWSVSLSADGNTAIVGGYADNGAAGAAWVYTIAPAPTISSFTPASGPPGTLVTISGTNLSNTGSQTALSIGGVTVLVISNTGTTLVGFVMPTAATGAVSITTNGGIATAGGNFTVTATPYPGTQQGSKLVGTGAIGNAWQGFSVALSADGNTAIVGGYSDNSNAGAAWIYTRSGGTWSQQGSKLVGTGATGVAEQGYSVSLSADGNTAIVGGYDDNSGTGAVWVYTRSGTTWTQQGSKLVGTGASGAAYQGWSVSLSADGNTAIVGGWFDNSYAGAAWIYTRSGTTWTQQGSKLVGTGATGVARQGISVSLSADGNTAIVGGTTDNSAAGAAWIYTLSGGTWTQQGSKLVGTGAVGLAGQGASVSLSADGNTAIVGGSSDNSDAGAAWVYTQSGGTWSQQGSKLVGTGAVGSTVFQGASVALSADGNTAIVGGWFDNSYAGGAAWIYTRSGTTWTQQGSKLVGTGATGVARQGWSVSLSADGNTAIVGGAGDNSYAGAAWVYTAPLPQGSLTANGPFCTSGTGQLTWTATAGIGPFTVVYYDGTANQTATGVVSGTPFNVFTEPVTVTTTYTLVSVTDADNDVSGGTFTAGSATITVNNVVTPSVSIAIISGSQTICSGSSVTFTGTPNNGGAAPAYNFEVNGNSVQNGTSATFTSTSLNNNDAVTCIMTSNAACASPTTATSNSITMTVNPVLTPAVSISITSGSQTICAGSGVTFTAVPTNGGSAPDYNFQVNGISVQDGASPVYSSTSLNNNDEVSCILTSNATCASPTAATSNSINMTVNPILTPSVSIAITSGSQTTCSGSSVTFTATPTNGGSTPAYNFEVNGNSVQNGASASYSSTTLNDNDVVRCIMTSNATCVSPTTATSNNITMTVGAVLTPQVSISASQTDICAGTSITFTATPTAGGSGPVYNFKVNGNSVQNGTSATYSSATLNNNDVVSCVMTSNSACASPATATSNDITVTVSVVLTPVVSIAITSGSQTICAGSSVTFTATPTIGGSAPNYNFEVKGNSVQNGTSATFTSTSLNNNDAVTCIMTSNASCASPTTANSNSITMTVNPLLTPAVNISITSGSQTICAGSGVTFTAIPTNGGSAPDYNFQVNGISVQNGTSDTYASASLNNSDAVTCKLMSDATCASPATANSNSITMMVNPVLIPTVSISITSGSQTICTGSDVTFTAVPDNGGSAPDYNFQVNGISVQDGASLVYSSTSLNNNDAVACILTSNATCASPAMANSNSITMTVNSCGPVITSFTPASGPIGSTVTITGINFNIAASQNIVFFGATKATVTAASATSLTVKVPLGATYEYLSETNLGINLTAYSGIPFITTFAGNIDFAPQQVWNVPSSPNSVSIGDVDGDGLPDLLIADGGGGGSLWIYRNTSTPGNVSFGPLLTFSAGNDATNINISDIDGDGKPDLAVANYGNNNISVFLNTSTPGNISFASGVTFGTGTGPITSLNSSDIDGDGRPDLATVDNSGNTISVLRNTSTPGNISFASQLTFATGSGPYGLGIGDIDGDGKPDLAAFNQGDNTVSVLLNTSTPGNVSFATQITFATGSFPEVGSIGDIDGDGKLDLVSANYSGSSVSVLRNTSIVGNISFAPQVTFATGSGNNQVSIGDVDGDGKPDLVAPNNGSSSVSVLQNTSTPGSVSFAAAVEFPAGSLSAFTAIGDIDGDGKTDLVVANYSANTISILRQITSTNTWLGNSTDWTDPTNWSSENPPTGLCSENVSIPGGTTNEPTIRSTESVGNISLASGASITLSGVNLNVCGNITGGSGASDGDILGTGELVLNGTTQQQIGGKVEVQSIQINNTAGVQMQSGSELDIYTTLQLAAGQFDATNGTTKLMSTSVTQAAIIDNFSNNNFAGTYKGNVTAERFYGSASASNDFSQHMLGSPVSGINLSALGSTTASAAYYEAETGGVHNCNELVGQPGTPYGNVFSYVESHASTCVQDGWLVDAASTPDSSGKGYSVILGAGSGTLSLTGAPNLNSSYNIPTTNSGYANTTSDQGRVYPPGDNLLSNPYPAALNVAALIADNAGSYSPVVYSWNEISGSYYMPDTLAPFQAFKIIQTATGNANYIINGTSRTLNAGTFQRMQNPSELNMTVTNNTTGLTDETTVGFNPNSTAKFNPAYDIIKLPGALNRHTLYSINGNDWMWVNIFNSINETSTVPVGFEPGVSGTYTVNFSGINSFDPTSYVTLEDTKLNVFLNVRNGSYTFTSDAASDSWNRFVLHFTPPASISTTTATCSEPGMINVIQPGTANWNYTVTDNSNTVISSGILNSSTSITVSAIAGAYTVTLVDNNGYTVVKNIQVTGTDAVSASINASATTIQQNETVTFMAVSDDATNYSWNFGDGTTATAPAEVHTYQEPGIYNVTLTASNMAGCLSTSSKSITVTSRSVTGIINIGDNSISIWSNDNKVYVDFTNAGLVDATVTLYNIIGQQISQEKFTANAVYTKEFDNIEAGYVVVNAKNGDDVVTRKVFIINNK